MYVVTADQRASSSHGDAVPAALAAASAAAPGAVLAFERTVGDELQGVVTTPEEALAVVRALARAGRWSIGVGLGAVDRPLPASTREARGAAFLRARDAVERARRRGGAVAVAVTGGPAEPRAAEAEALLGLVAAVVARRSEAGQAAVESVLDEGRTQGEAAELLGVTAQAVSQRLAAALGAEERAVGPLALRLLHAAHDASDATADQGPTTEAATTEAATTGADTTEESSA